MSAHFHTNAPLDRNSERIVPNSAPVEYCTTSKKQKVLHFSWLGCRHRSSSFQRNYTVHMYVYTEYFKKCDTSSMMPGMWVTIPVVSFSKLARTYGTFQQITVLFSSPIRSRKYVCEFEFWGYNYCGTTKKFAEDWNNQFVISPLFFVLFNCYFRD